MQTETLSAPAALSPAQLEKRVLRLAWPVIGENLLQTMLGVVDTILVASLGAVALAGVGAALQVIYVITAALSALSVGVAVLVAQAFGGGRLAEAGQLARQGLLWSALIGLPLTAIGLQLTPALIGLFGLAPDVAQVGIDYLSVTIGSITTLTIMYLIGGALRGLGDSRTPMLVTAFANLINVVASAILIYGWLGAPALGAVGSAWGSVIARLVGAAALIGVIWRGRNGARAGGRGNWWPQARVLRHVLRIGMPAALEEVLIIGAIASLTPVVATLGTVALAAHRVAINVLSLSFLPGIGFGLAATALVGQAIGAQRPAEAGAVAMIALRWTVIWMGGLGLLFLIFAEGLVSIFNRDPQLVAAGAAAVRVVALTQPAWAITFALGGALRGLGDTLSPLVISGSAIWICVGLALVIVTWWAPALWGVWLAFLIVGPFEAAVFWRVWRQRIAARNVAPQRALVSGHDNPPLPE
ncbi:MATE family efflux transporter [Chloroflexus sp.]|uniref:MATE family efflux transporter n=1 Tax=Chloroflexus sp. TaxID=1904827 RepID=UPI0026335F35|nr:MATE family efflux transporter [uncultured Chloroflexus sp.]